MKIGITGYMDGDHFGVNAQYMDFASNIGTPIVLSPGEIPSADIDGLLLPGGADVSNLRNGSMPGFNTGKPNPILDYFDTNILPLVYGKMPIFGICRGLQTVNVMLGGSLIQHLIYHPFSSNDFDAVHTITARGVVKPFKVNSFHHQAIDVLAAGLSIEAQSTADTQSVIEAVSGHMFFAVQWHPERLLDAYSANKFKGLFS